MKLNGWKRIGIIASVVWMVGAGPYTLWIVGKANDRQFEESDRVECLPILGSNRTIYEHCVANLSNYRLSQIPYERLDAVLMAIVPVPFAWGLAYLVLFLVRWVKRGFV